MNVRPLVVAMWMMVAFAWQPTASAQDYKPGDAIEYKVRGTVDQWERGTVLRVLDGGKQYVIRQKPTQFFPEGAESAYSPADLRPPQNAKPKTDDAPARPSPTPAGEAKPPAVKPAPADNPPPAGEGLLSAADVLAYTKQVFGPGDPFADSQRRERILNQIRDYIKARGTSFLPDLKFKNDMHALGATSVHINSAIEDNYGRTPALQDYFGTYLMRAANRGTTSVRKVDGKDTLFVEDGQFTAGSLTINKDGTYVWKLGANDPEAQWVKGKWRVATPDETQAWEGGPSLWLEKARQGEDYSIRMSRVPGYEGWIDVGMGKGRIAIHYGRRAQ